MIVEFVRGLGMGGAESLLNSRLQSEEHSGSYRTARVVNTYSSDDYFAESIENSVVPVVDLGTSSRWISAWRLWSVAPQLAPTDIAVFHSPWPAAVFKLRRALHLKTPRIVEVAHSTRYARPMLLLGKLLNPFANLCIAVSQDVALSPTTYGFRRKRVVHAGVNREDMRAWVGENELGPAQFRAELRLEESTKLVVSVGSLLPGKRHSLLVKAAVELRDRCHFVIIGTGPELGVLQDLANDLGVTDRVHFLGRRANAWRWMAVADLVVHPSAWEGLSIALIEAKVLGVPVVAYDVGGVSTVIGGDLGSIVLDKECVDGLPRAIGETLDGLVPLQEIFAQRASKDVGWDIEAYSDEFYDAIGEA